MSKETEINVSVTVKDGPKTQPQKTKLPKEYCATNVSKAINEEVVVDATNCSQDNHVKFSLETGEKLAFITIHADQYMYKDSCGKEQPGVYYYHTTADKEFLDGPHVYVYRRLQPLTLAQLHFKVCEDMFNCISDPEKKRVVINVTYGIGKEEACPKCKPCQSTTTSTTAANASPTQACAGE